MTTFNTGNPIGSTDARDRLDNSENMDILENSTTLNAHADRLGIMRKTRKGMELEHDNQISAHEVEHDAQISAHEAEHGNQMQSFENEFDVRLAGMAFTRVGTFTAGATLTDMRQTLIWELSQGGDGREYGWTGSFLPAGKVVAAGASPTPVSAGNWVDRTEDRLRSDINIITKRFSHVAQMKAAIQLGDEGKLVEWVSYYDGWASLFDKQIGGNIGVVVPAGTGTADEGSLFDTTSGLQVKAIFSTAPTPEHFGARGDGVTNDTPVIQKLVRASSNIEFSSKKYLMSGHVILDSPDINMKTNGAVFEQVLFGHPCFEIKAKNVRMHGDWRFKYTGARTTVISSNTLGYSYVDAGNYKDYGSAIWQNYYEGRDLSGFFLEKLYVYGFINGAWIGAAGCDIGDCYFDTTDMGISGVAENNMRIGDIYHTNITASQSVEGHSLYLNGTGVDLVVGDIRVKNSPLGCSPVKLHQTKNFYIRGISGNGLGAIGNFRDGVTGVIGSISGDLSVNAAYSGVTYNILAYGDGTDITLENVSVTANQSGTVYENFTQCSSNGILRIGNIRYHNSISSNTAPRLNRCTSEGSFKLFGQADIAYSNANPDNYIFDGTSYGSYEIQMPPRVSVPSGDVKLYKNTYQSGKAYLLAIDTNKLSSWGDSTVIDTSNLTFGCSLITTNPTVKSITGGFPVVTCIQSGVLTQSAATDLIRLKYSNPGQIIRLYNSDGNTNLYHNGASGQDGNIITPTAATIGRASWKFADLIKIGSNFYVCNYI